MIRNILLYFLFLFLEAKTSWIMPFTAGGFLHISLVTVLPELILEENPKESIKQFTLIISGIMVMFVMSNLFEWWCIYSTLFPYSHHIIPLNKKTILLFILLFYYIITLVKCYPYYLVNIIIFIILLFFICIIHKNYQFDSNI